jgi:hypothetical protein
MVGAMTASTQIAPKTGLENVTLSDSHGNPVHLGELWARGPAVLVWMRHYG